MAVTITISKRIFIPILTLFAGFVLGVTGTLPSNAEDTAPVVQGEVLNVCVNLKTGAIRVSSKCVAKTERKVILGGTGAQGAKGDKGDVGATGAAGPVGPQGPAGATGPQGERGLTGLTGEKGSQGSQGPTGATGPSGITGLRTVKIDFLTGYYYNWCNGSGRSIAISGTTLPACSVTVYVP